MLHCYYCGNEFNETEAKENQLCPKCHQGYLFIVNLTSPIDLPDNCICSRAKTGTPGLLQFVWNENCPVHGGDYCVIDQV